MKVLVIPAPFAIGNGLRHQWILAALRGKEDAKPSFVDVIWQPRY